MTTFPIHTLSSAPAASKPALQQLQDGFGFIPNVAGAIANSPVLMKAFAAVFANVHGEQRPVAEVIRAAITAHVETRRRDPQFQDQLRGRIDRAQKFLQR